MRARNERKTCTSRGDEPVVQHDQDGTASGSNNLPRVEQHRCGVIRTKKGWLEKKRKGEKGELALSRKWLR
jgi:hypothetical protein